MDLYERFGAWPAVQYATPLPGTGLAKGRSLPVVDDWGPHFQTAPSQPDAAVSPDTLARFRWTFEQRLRASEGPQKVIMNVTYVCNNRCTFCAVGTRTQIDGHPTRQREHLAKYRSLGGRMVDFDGGEPTKKTFAGAKQPADNFGDDPVRDLSQSPGRSRYDDDPFITSSSNLFSDDDYASVLSAPATPSYVSVDASFVEDDGGDLDVPDFIK
jgi:hypothetical protein